MEGKNWFSHFAAISDLYAFCLKKKDKMSASMFLPMQLVSKCLNKRVVVVLEGGHEVQGTLRHFDSTCTLHLSDATHFATVVEKEGVLGGLEEIAQGAQAGRVRRIKQAEYSTMLVNSAHVHLIVPGGLPSQQ